MKYTGTNFLIAIFFILLTYGVKAQVTVTNPANTTPNLAATYTSLANVIAALNTRTTITGPVTITLNPGNPETAPVGGYAINFATIVNNSFPVVISGSNNTITAFTPQTSGSLTDAIFKIIGADFITIENFVMQENGGNTNANTSPNTNNMTECGVALLYVNNTDGAQNNTIQNNIISLNKAYRNTFGIYSNVRHAATLVTSVADIQNGTTAPNKNNKVYGNSISNVNMGITFIGSANPDYMDTDNDIGGNSAATGNSITNWGGSDPSTTFASNSGTYHGIFVNHQKNENVSYNTITSAVLNGTVAVIRGIYKAYKTNPPNGSFTSTINNNSITIKDNMNGADVYGIYSDGMAALITATININNNVLLNNIINAAGSANNFAGITNTSQAGIININGNIFRGTSSNATTGSFGGIVSNGAVTTQNINNNFIGDASGNAISFSVANTAAAGIVGISTTPSSTATLSISNNNFQGIVESVLGTRVHTYINIGSGHTTANAYNINDNLFTNITANTSGNVTFISRTAGMSIAAGASENCNNNKIVTQFSKAAGGTVALLKTSASSTLGTLTQTGNDFSNITLTGATIMSGWNNTDGSGSGPAKTISNNIFKNWSCGSSPVVVLLSNNGGSGTTISGNDIENISASGIVTGISLGSGATGTLQVNNNAINGLSSSGSGITSAIEFLSAATVNCFRNKIYDLSGSNSGSLVYGIKSSTGSSSIVNIHNNLVGDIRATAANVDDAVVGIKFTSAAISSSLNVYYNTIYLSASSSGTNFGSSGISCVSHGTSTTGALTLRNNIVVNKSTSNGSGFTVAYRRSSTILNNFAAASNNIYYSGTPSATNLIFYDGTNSYQTLAAYKGGVTPKDANSFTELPPFLSTSGVSVNFLHLNTTVPTQAESGGVNIAGYSNDYENDIRQGNAGYTGLGTAPDIGADEMSGVYSELNPPGIIYTDLSPTTCTFSNTKIIGATITDDTGVPLSGTLIPRIYYRKNSGPWFSNAGANTGGTTTNSTWDFTIIAADMGALVGGDVVSYYIIAQDLNPVPNVISNPATGLVATSVNNVTIHPTTPKTYTLRYNLTGTYTVGVGGDFATLTNAANAYNNACSLNGAVYFVLTDNSYPSETFPISFNNHVDASSINTLTIRPSATAVPIITGSSLTQLINLNGARYISFDGRQNGVGVARSLTISNTGGGTTIQFINDAQNDNVKYCIVKGQYTSGFNGTISFMTANITGTGNDNNTIDNNEISEAGGFSCNGIYSSGTASKENDHNSITNNDISNYFNATTASHGIFIRTGSDWTITNNRLFQTATRLYTTANYHFGIYITSGSGYAINNNTIGFSNSSGTGTTNMIGNNAGLAGFPSSYSVSGTAVDIRYIGIGGNFDLIGTTSTIDGNTIGGFAMYTLSNAATGSGMFSGIYIESGTANIGVNAGNIIGGTTGNNSIYVATGAAGGAIVAIRAASVGIAAIQNNTIGSILSSGTSAGISGGFTGISVGGLCNFTVSNNFIGNANADNIRIGYASSGGLLSNTAPLVATNAGVLATFKGITSASTGNSLTINNNTLRGWVSACGSTSYTGIESTGTLTGPSPSLNINNNFLGTSINWLNSIVDNNVYSYGINVSSLGTTTNNIKDNDIRGIFLGAQKGTGATLIRLSNATSANNISTISGNTFTNVNYKLSTGSLYFIVTAYTLSSTSQLIINNNKITGNLTLSSSGNADYHFLFSSMGSSAGSQVNVTNNDFSNITAAAATGFASDLFGSYTSFGGGSSLLTLNSNKFTNWNFGTGSVTGFDISNIAGTATCSNNKLTSITGNGDVEGIHLSPASSSGQFNVINDTISGITSTIGYIYAITGIIPPAAGNTTQTNISNNIVNGLSSSLNTAVIAGIFLNSGAASATVSVSKNKIYDLSGSGTGCFVYGINNYTSLAGKITYSNNYVGDLRAPLSNAAAPAIAGLNLFMAGGQANVFYNTIHLNASGSAAGFSTASVYANAATPVTLRNNIFSNTSTAGASGKTVAYWRGGTSLVAYDAASNNNVFYAGTASPQKLIFYDGANSDQTITTYQARVTPRDNLSVSVLPNYISTLGANANFLHINSTGNCGIGGGGNNSGILLSTDYDGDSRMITSPYLTDIGADEATKTNKWTGANSNNWNDAGNWSQAIVPNATGINVYITNPPASQPIIDATGVFQVGNLVIQAGASLTNKGTLKIDGLIKATTGSINNIQAGIVEGSVEMNGSCSTAQSLSGNVFVNNSVKNFTVSSDVNISAVAGENLNISRALSFGAVTGKTLNTGDNITLLSTETATSNVGDITGNSISGKATVERYVNTGLLADGRHLKTWQFLATPTSGQTIFNSWQESGLTPTGYGTIITGTGVGFDLASALPSMKFFDPTMGTNGNWAGVTNTGSQLNDQRGYMIFVRGDRNVTAINGNPNPTNLRSKGTLFQPNNPPPVTNVLAGKLASVGNPYASAIDVKYMKNNGKFVNLNNDVVVWDPLLYGSYGYGGYQTLAAANNYIPTAGGTTYYPSGVSSPYIQSGQAFFVKSSGLAGSVSFTETCKKDTNKLVNRNSERIQQKQFFRATLFTNAGYIADGNAAVFSNDYRNSVDADDAAKFLNTGENFAIARDGLVLSVEARNIVTGADTVFYRLSNLKKQSYQFRFAPENMQLSGLTAFLVDKYLNSLTQLSLVDSSFINFDINSENLSYAADRFYVIFKHRTRIPTYSSTKDTTLKGRSSNNDPELKNEKGSISIYPNPVENKILRLCFIELVTGSYHLQLINNLGQPVYSTDLVISEANSIKQIKIDEAIPTGNYLLNIYSEKGKKYGLHVIIR